MKKVILWIGVILFLSAGCSTEAVKNNSKPAKPSYIPQKKANTKPSALIPKQEAKPIIQENNSQAAGVFTIKVTQIVEGSSQEEFSAAEGTTALSLLELTHRVEKKNYSGIGGMVIGIDGKNSDSKHFWEFFINGKSSNVGAGSYIIKNGDSIEWKFSLIN